LYSLSDNAIDGSNYKTILVAYQLNTTNFRGKASQNFQKTGKTAATTQHDNATPETMADETARKQ